MQHALLVRGGEPRGDLARDVERLVLREAPDAAQQRREVLAVHELHREEVLPLGLADVPHAADRRVRDLARHAHLAVEALEALGVALERARQELEGDRLLELQVVGAVDLAHPAAAEQADDAVALGEHRARARSDPRAGAGGPARASTGAWSCLAGATGVRPRDQRRGAVPVGLSATSRSVPQPGQKREPSATRARAGGTGAHGGGVASTTIRAACPELHHPGRPASGDRNPDTGRLAVAVSASSSVGCRPARELLSLGRARNEHEF